MRKTFSNISEDITYVPTHKAYHPFSRENGVGIKKYHNRAAEGGFAGSRLPLFLFARYEVGSAPVLKACK